jgi:acyl-CoA synthetase (AMP-forming)/AMP-acid ligase II
VLRLFEEERGTVMLCVPTMLIRMLEHPRSAIAIFHHGGW